MIPSFHSQVWDRSSEPNQEILYMIRKSKFIVFVQAPAWIFVRPFSTENIWWTCLPLDAGWCQFNCVINRDLSGGDYSGARDVHPTLPDPCTQEGVSSIFLGFRSYPSGIRTFEQHFSKCTCHSSLVALHFQGFLHTQHTFQQYG